jgi:hypothetical protein
MAWTKEKQSEYHRQYRLERLEEKRAYDKLRYSERKASILAQTKRRRQENRAWLVEQKAKPCADCEGCFPSPVMEYHHRDPAKKSFTVGMNLGASRVRLVAEIAKCDLICANCHRIRTHARVAA